eukprot:TRINITY_DN336_c1_g1_i1.p1 TRINITY_DN336_c1_g1~~TRINITY_DN336_c1_g1_i1.p1  ORF type:complete len:261 (-),score=70.82 TRINITY_DN336_c1_g1_i1:14-796(-)
MDNEQEISDEDLKYQLIYSDLSDKYPDEKEIILKRYILGSYYDLSNAHEFYQQYLEFKENNLNTSPNDFIGELKLQAFYFHGQTKQNIPLIIVKPSNFDFNQATDGVNSVLKLNYWVMEEVFKVVPDIQKCTLVVDCSGLGFSNFNYDCFQQIANFYNEIYPEVLHSEYLINTNWLFRGIWKMFQGFVHESTRKKINIIGSDYQDILLENISPENLPVEFGGVSEFKLYDNIDDINSVDDAEILVQGLGNFDNKEIKVED